MIAARVILIAAKRTAEDGLHAEHCRQASGDLNLLCLEAASWSDDAAHGTIHHYSGTHSTTYGITKPDHVGVAQQVVRPRTRAFNLDDAVRLRVRQRAQEDSIENGEDSDVGAQAKREHSNRGDGESRRVAQLAEPVTHVLQNRCHLRSPPNPREALSWARRRRRGERESNWQSRMR